MAAVSDTDADKQTTAQFHQFVDLPAEMRIKIIQEFIHTLREERRSRPRLAGPLPFGKFALFAVIHSEWQHEFEAQQELFGSLCLSTDDLPAFRTMLNQQRSRFLSEVGLRVFIDDKVISFSGQFSAVVSRASDFIVNSVATILKIVEDTTRTASQTAKAKLGFYTQIMTPGDLGLGYPRFRQDSSQPNGIDCDFSLLPLTQATRKLSQRKVPYFQLQALSYPRLLSLSPSSMLSLASRMPNLEEADIGILSRASLSGISALQTNACPRLKNLRVPIFPTGPPTYNVARWCSFWSTKIENIEVVSTEIPSFLRNLVKLQGISEASAWPNLQVLKLGGSSIAGRVSGLVDFLTPSEGPIDALSAMAVALPWLPSIREMTIDLNVLAVSLLTSEGRVNVFRFFVAITLYLGSGSGNLTISQPSEHRGRSGLSHTLWRISGESDELSFKHHMGNAVAEVQAAVRKHRGHDLEIVWPEADGEPQLG